MATSGLPLAAPGSDDERRVDARERAGRLERPREHVVEVDRAGELAEDRAARALLLRPLEGARRARVPSSSMRAFRPRTDGSAIRSSARAVGAPCDHEQQRGGRTTRQRQGRALIAISTAYVNAAGRSHRRGLTVVTLSRVCTRAC